MVVVPKTERAWDEISQLEHKQQPTLLETKLYKHKAGKKGRGNVNGTGKYFDINPGGFYGEKDREARPKLNHLENTRLCYALPLARVSSSAINFPKVPSSNSTTPCSTPSVLQ